MQFKRLCIRSISSVLVLTFMLTYNAVSICAEDKPYGKEENVYVNLNYDGSIKETTVVNSFKLNSNSKIIDYGNYTNIRNTSSTAKPKINNGYIEWDVDKNADSFYYQGDLKNVNLPWNFKITYKLDGKEVSGDKLIGASGNMEVKIDVTANQNANKYFADNYMAQISASLDTEKCKNITVKDATIANAGAKKQITFMVLPKTSKTFYINANVNDFEADAINVAMVSMADSLPKDIDTLKLGVSSLSGGVSQLLDGTGQLKNGATDLCTGIGLLSDGAVSVAQVTPMLSSGMSQFSSGLKQISDGMAQVSSGSVSVRNGLGDLDSNSYALSNGLSQIQSGLKQMYEKKADTMVGLRELEKNKNSISQLPDSGNAILNGYSQLEEGLGTMAAGKDNVDDAIEELGDNKPDISAVVGIASSLSSDINSMDSTSQSQLEKINTLLNAASSDPNLAEYKDMLSGIYSDAQDLKTRLATANTNAGIVQAGVSGAQSGLNQLHGAAMQFATSTEQVLSGAGTMQANMSMLNSGLKAYVNGVSSLGQLYDAAEAYGNSTLKLMDAAQSLSNGFEEICTAFDKYSGGINAIAANYVALDSAIYELGNGTLSIKDNYDNLKYASDGIFQAVNELADSLKMLDSSASKLPEGIESIANGGNQLISGVSSAGGEVGGLIDMSSSAQPVSFVAPNIVSPNKVQIVVKTPDFTKPDVNNTEQPKEKQNIFQKLIQLFKRKEK